VFRAFAYSSDAIKQVEFSPGLPVFIGSKRFVHFHGNEAPPRDRIDVNQAPAAGKPRRRNSAADAEVPEGVPLIEEVGFATDSPLEGDGFEPSVPEPRNVRSRALFRSDRGHYRRREAPDPQHQQRGRQASEAARHKRRGGNLR
jgi:hypothetical protein